MSFVVILPFLCLDSSKILKLLMTANGVPVRGERKIWR